MMEYLMQANAFITKPATLDLTLHFKDFFMFLKKKKRKYNHRRKTKLLSD